MAAVNARKTITLTAAAATNSGIGAAHFFGKNSFPATLTLAADGSNTGSVEVTNYPASAVQADTAVWEVWPAGTVVVNSFDTLLGPVTAVRPIAATGSVTLVVQEAE